MASPHSHLPFGEEGTSFYSLHTKGCFQVIESSSKMVWEALEAVIDEFIETPFLSIVDFGANDGGTSSTLWKNVLEKIRKKHPHLPIWLHYEDQPTNDWKSLFLQVHGLLKHREGSMNSLKKEFENLFVSCCGTSFYEQCFPPASVQFIFSATAMHWLSSPPKCLITDALHCATSTDPTAREIMKQQASGDWETNLLHRATELSPGGHMVLVNLGTDENNQFLGSTHNITVKIFDKFFELWKSLMETGRITKEEFDSTLFANYYRSEAEIIAPFKDEDSKIWNAGLRLVSITTKQIPCTYRNYLESHPDMDPKEYAKWYVPTLRTWSNTTFFSALSSSRLTEERNQIVDDLFDLYQKEVERAPFDHGMDYIHTHVHIKKVNQKSE